MTVENNSDDLLPANGGTEVVIPEDSLGDNGEPEVLYRQITQTKWDPDQKRPGTNAFYPQRSDERRPSLGRSSKTTASESFEWHNSHARSQSLSTWACSVAAVHRAGTTPIDDSAVPLQENEVRAPGHAFVDYREMEKSKMKIIAAHLLLDAYERGQVYPPTPS